MESTQEANKNVTFNENNNTDSTAEDYACPDADLLQMQKRKSQPRVSITAVNQDAEEEQTLVEVDDFAHLEHTPMHFGLYAEGKDEEALNIVKQVSSSDDQKS